MLAPTHWNPRQTWLAAGNYSALPRRPHSRRSRSMICGRPLPARVRTHGIGKMLPAAVGSVEDDLASGSCYGISMRKDFASVVPVRVNVTVTYPRAKAANVKR